MTKSQFTKDYEKFRSLLIKVRKDSNITQDELADILGKPQSFVSKYEIGERRLDVIEFINIARALGQEPEKLFRDLLVSVDKQ